MKRFCFIMMLMTACFAWSGVSAEDVNTGTVIGKAMIKDGQPMANGVVYFFNDASGPPPSDDKYWRVPDEIITTDAAGNFTAKLVEGKYYVGAIKRSKSASGQEVGPPQQGDLFLPLHSENGNPKLLIVSTGKTTDLGTVTGAYPFQKKTPKTKDGITAIEGKVTDARGKPVEKALVFAFLTPAMVGRPLFVSERTGKDGKYVLRVHQGGSYYLKVRDVYGGGALKAGDILGSYGQKQPLAVAVKTGSTVKGVDITGIRFPGAGPKKQ